MRALSCAATALALVPSAAAVAQDASDARPRGQVALGLGVAPDYDGADGVRAIPFVLADIRVGGVSFEARGLRGRVDLAADPRLSMGPVVGARLDRRDADGPVGLLPTIDIGVEVGGYVGYRFGGNALGQGSLSTELTLLHDVSGTSNGMVATATAGYAALRSRDSFAGFDLQASWADADHMRTYFGISAADAAASGLTRFRPGSGFRDVGAGISAGYYFSRHLGMIGRVGAAYLVGDAADSPITEAGSRWQPLGGLTLAYRF
jgi:outer membrane scaffolding protein for murein synthesis (MipA/OmpV family)